MPEQIEHIPYSQIVDLHSTLARGNPQLGELSLGEFSQLAQQATGKDFSAGANDNWLKKGAHYVGKASKWLGGNQLGAFAEVATKAAGFPEYGTYAREMGEQLPIGMVEMLPQFRAFQGVNALARTAGLVSAGARTYKDTDSPLAGVVGAGALAALPRMVSKGEKWAMKPIQKLFWEKAALGPTAKGVASITRPEVVTPFLKVMERGAEFAGRNVGAAVNQELAIQGTSVAAGGGLVPFDDPQHMFELIGGQLPFAAIEALGVIRPRFRGEPGSNARARAGAANAQAVKERSAYIDTANKALETSIAQQTPGVNDVLSSLKGQEQRDAISSSKRMRGRVLSEMHEAYTDGRPLDTTKLFEGASDLDKRMLSLVMDDMTNRPEGDGFFKPNADGTFEVVKQLDVQRVLDQRLAETPEAVQKATALYRESPEGGRDLPAVKRSFLADVFGVEQTTLEHPARVVQILTGGDTVTQQERAYDRLYLQQYWKPGDSQVVALYPQPFDVPSRPRLSLGQVADAKTAKQYILERYVERARATTKAKESVGTLAQMRHMVFGDGLYLQGEAGPVTFAKAAGGAEQVLIGGKGTDWVRTRSKDATGTEQTSFSQVGELEVKTLPEKVVVTKETLTESAQKVLAKHVEIEKNARLTFDEETQAVLRKMKMGLKDIYAQTAMDQPSGVEYDLFVAEPGMSPAEKKTAAVSKLLGLMPDSRRRQQVEAWLKHEKGDAARLSTPDEIVLLEGESQQLRAKIDSFGTQKMQRLAEAADVEHVARLEALASVLHQESGYSGGTAADKYATIMAQRTQLLSDIVHSQDSAAVRAIIQGWNREPRLVPAGEAKGARITAEGERALFDRLQVFASDPQFAPHFAGLNRALYAVVERGGRVDPLADVVSNVGLYQLFEEGTELMQGSVDVASGKNTPAARRWREAQEALVTRADPGLRPDNPEAVMRQGLKHKGAKVGKKSHDAIDRSTSLDDLTNALEVEVSRNPALFDVTQTDIPELFDAAVEAHVDQALQERLAAKVHGDTSVPMGEGAEVTRQVLEALGSLKFEAGQLKKLKLVNIVFDRRSGRVDWERTGRVDAIERERAKTGGSGMPLHEAMANTRDILINSGRYQLDVMIDSAGRLVVRTSAKRGGSITRAKEAVLEKVGMMTDAVKGMRETFMGNITQENVAKYPHSKVGDHVQDGMLENARAEYPDAGEVTLEALVQKMVSVEEFKYNAAVDKLFNVWAQDRGERSSLVTRVLRAGMGEVWANRPQQAARATPGRSVTREGNLVAQKVYLSKLRGDETPQAFQAAVRDMTFRQFESLGYGHAQATLYADTATRIVAAYKDVPKGAKLAVADAETFMGQAAVVREATPVVALLAANSGLFNGLSEAGQQAFLFNWLVGHESTHILTKKQFFGELPTAQQQAMTTLMRNVESMSGLERVAVIDSMFEAVIPAQYRESFAPLVYDRAQHSTDNWEFVSDVAALKVMGLVSPAESKLMFTGSKARHMRFAHGPDYLAHFDRALYATMKDFTMVLKDVAGKYPEVQKLAVHAESLNTQLDAALAERAEIDAVGQQMSKLASESATEYAKLVGEGQADFMVGDVTRFAPETDSTFNAVSYAKRFMGRDNAATVEKYFGVSPGWLERTFALPAFLAKRYPHLRDSIDAVFRFRPIANQGAHYMALPMLRESKIFGALKIGDKLDTKTTGLKTLTSNRKVHDAAVMVALLKQGVFEADGTMSQPGRVLSDTEIRDIARREGVTKPEHQQAVIDFHRNVEMVVPRMREWMLKSMRDVGGVSIAERLMNSDPTLTAKAAEQQGNALFQTVWAASHGDVGAQLLLANDPRTGVVQQATDFANRLKAFEERTDGADWFMPEIRLGDNMVVWLDARSKKHGSAGFKTRQEAIAKIQQLEADPHVSNIRSWNKWEKGGDYSGMNPALMSMIKNIEAASLLKQQVVEGWSGAEINAFGYTPLEATLRQVEDKGAERFLRERKHTPGREEVDMVKGFLTHITSMANGLAKEMTKKRVGLALNDPAIRNNLTSRNYARDHFNAVVNPGGREWSGVKKLNFAYFMGANLSSMLIEPTQALVALAPTLTRDTGNATASVLSVGKAVAMLGKFATKKGSLVDNLRKVDIDMADALDWAVANQLIDFGTMQEFQMATDDSLLQLNSLMHGGSVAEKSGRVTMAAFNSYVDFTRTVYSQVPKLNNVVAFLAAYESGRKHGVLQGGKLVKLKGVAARDYAADTVRSTMYGGGAAARPGAFHRSGKFQGVMGLGYSLGTYTFGILSHFAKLGAESIDRRGLLTPVERAAARKALGQTIATQVALAGALGLPGAGAALAVIEQVFPGLQARKAVEDGLEQLFNEDDEHAGGLLTDFALRGAPYSFGKVDLSSRLAISNVLGVSAYDGFRLANVAGPTGSVVENMVRATGMASQGLVGDAAETLLPTAYKNVVKLWRDGWEVKDAYGRTLIQPDTNELLLDAIGLRPARLSRAREAQRQIRRSEEAAGDEQSRFHRELGQRLLEGDANGVREALFERQTTTRGYDARAGAQAVAEAALSLALPYDPARVGASSNASERQRLALRGGFTQTSEFDRLATKKRLESAIGVPGVGRVMPAQMRQAMLVEQLMDGNPYMSRSEALAIANGRPY